jgi:hypothetical protein
MLGIDPMQFSRIGKSRERKLARRVLSPALFDIARPQ